MIWSGIHLKVSRQGFSFPPKMSIYIVALALCTVAGTFFMNLGLMIAPVSVIAALTASNPLVSTLYGRIVFKEKLRKIQYFAALLMVAGIILISINT